MSIPTFVRNASNTLAMRYLLNLLLLSATFLPRVLGAASYDEYRDADLAQSGYL